MGEFDNELSEYDLLGTEDEAATLTDLTATIDAVSSRLQRKKKEQEQAETSADKASRERQVVLLKGMAKIRRSLSEVVRLDLGGRFSLCLETDDWQGWPRLIIRLKDELLPKAEYPLFQVYGHDRTGKGTLEIHFGAPVQAAGMYLNQETDLQRLPTMLKKCVRAYLDQTAETVLNAEKDGIPESDEKAIQTGSASEIDKHQPVEAIAGEESFFESDYNADFLERLPSIDNLDTLEVSFEMPQTREVK